MNRRAILTQKDWDLLPRELDGATLLEIKGEGLQMTLSDSSPQVRFLAKAGTLILKGDAHPSITASAGQPLIEAEDISHPHIHISGNAQPLITAEGSSQPLVQASGQSQVDFLACDQAQPTLVLRGQSTAELNLWDLSKTSLETADLARATVIANEQAELDAAPDTRALLEWYSDAPAPKLFLPGARRAMEIPLPPPGFEKPRIK
ncbi:MAG: hypothetical protein PW734_12325 [Verrucomicrobium sp.]|nr:hypothetical protein [Verrucomicrobium sp.]